MRGLELACLLAPILACSGRADDLPATHGSTDATTTATITTDDTPTTDTTASTGAPSYDRPDCATLTLPGDPADLALTPRPDRDAEVLALTLDPSLAVAPQAHYEVIAGDLAAIRALAPQLAEIHENCRYPNGLQMWFWAGMQPLMLAAVNGEYHGWDCHNEAYAASGIGLIDGIALAFRLDGVHGDAVRDAYAALPGFEQVEVSGCWYDKSPCSVCEPTGSITLTPTFTGQGELDTREYRFESLDLEITVYRVSPGQPPQLIE